jgi:hypothetical protein
LHFLGRTTTNAGLVVLGWISPDVDLCDDVSIRHDHHDHP